MYSLNASKIYNVHAILHGLIIGIITRNKTALFEYDSIVMHDKNIFYSFQMKKCIILIQI